MITLYPMMESDEFKDARAAVESRAQAAVGVERDKGIYPPFVDLSVLCMENLLSRGGMEQAAPLLEALRKQAQVDDKEYADRRAISVRGVEKVAAGKNYPAILEKLRAKNPFAIRMIEAFGPTAARSLIERMKVSDSVAERTDLAQLILKAGPEAAEIMAEELQQVRAPSEALKLLDLVPLSMADSQAESALGMSLRHPALAVRRKAATLLGGRGFPRAGSYLVEALRKEADPSARLLFVETIGNLKYDAALTTLGTILDSRSETDDVRSTAAAALANLGKPGAIPLLTRASAKGRGFTLVLNAAPTSVRAAAVRALGAYTRFPEARDALRKAQEDPEVLVREAAREALLSSIVKVFGDSAKRAGFVSDSDQLSRFSQGGVAGYLSEVPLDQICQIMEEGQRTGLLYLNVGGSNAKVYVDKGDVIFAEYNGLKGQDAFNLFCRWEGTYFMFSPGIHSPTPGAPRSLIKMMMDACELRDRNDRPGSAK
jgi:HEAT repeat protein